ncbi:hypothetical protein ACHAPJ_003126 [Fusarium lateritium]
MATLDQDGEPHYEYILKEMYVPPGNEGSFAGQNDVVDLVFVHGLGGNLKTTWKQEGTTEPWFTKPEFLGRLKDSIRVLSFGYNAQRFGDVANTRIIHHANDLLRNLVLKRLDHTVRVSRFSEAQPANVRTGPTFDLYSTQPWWARGQEGEITIYD